jgi:nucleolar GTP-binding protein
MDEPVVTAKDLQEEMGGAGVFYIPNQYHFKLENADWNFDKVPEFMDGMNVADF